MTTTMNEDSIKRIEYNLAQLFFLFSPQSYSLLEWGRGTGKSTIIAKRIIDCVVEMPRSCGVIVGETYMTIKTRTLPSTIAGLEQHGYLKDVHYYIGEKPPAHNKWPEAYTPPLDHKNCIFFWNGTVIIMISQDAGAGSGRGLNTDFVIGDEAARLDEVKFNNDVLLTNRGNKFRKAVYPDGSFKYFKDCKLHHSVLLATTTPVTQAGMWVLKYDALAKKYPKKYRVIRASARINKKNLGAKYFKSAKASMPKFMYDAEVENIRVNKVDRAFYPNLNEHKHGYYAVNNSYFDNYQVGQQITCDGDSDIDFNEALDVSIDWGASINSLTISQLQGNEYKFLKDMNVKSPLILEDLIKLEFIPYYAPFQQRGCQRINLFYDATGNFQQANSRLTYAQEVRQILMDAGYFVELMTHGLINNDHAKKYLLWSKFLKEEDPIYPHVRFNRSNCTNLLISMSNAPAKKGVNTPIQKDKKSEKNKSIPAEHATHLSDCADNVLYGRFSILLSKNNTSVPGPMFGN